MSWETDIVKEVVELRALVSRLKSALKTIEPDLTTPSAHEIVNKALADNGHLNYEIH